MSEWGLKPCPFCGGVAHVSELKQAVRPSPRYYVCCSNQRGNCIASFSGTFGKRYYSEQEAIEQWNRRAKNEER